MTTSTPTLPSSLRTRNTSTPSSPATSTSPVFLRGSSPTSPGAEAALGCLPRSSTASTSTGTCTTATVTAWVKELSAYIKSIDSNHLVAIGDEGFYNQPSAATYPYQGSEGVDFAANLLISTVDFGTFHDSWGQSGNETAWGTQWIADHAASQASANKPVILEEFGVTSNQATVYQAWWNEVISSGLAGDLIW
ncbi:hypothetical protein H0H93_000540 [Arthromyces matolae]|nr:hypothetical protein H0H93_000540 [Arthromyces matolae]